MKYDLKEINFRTVQDPKGFCEECEERYQQEFVEVLSKITEREE